MPHKSALAVTTAEGHIVILLSCIANIVVTITGLKSLRHKLNGHLESHAAGQFPVPPVVHDPPEGLL